MGETKSRETTQTDEAFFPSWPKSLVDMLASLSRGSTAQVTMTGSLEKDLRKYPGLWGEVSLLLDEWDVIEKGVKATLDVIKSNG